MPDAGTAAEAPARATPRLVSVCDACAAGSLWPFSGELHAFALHTASTPAHARAQALLARHRRSLLVLYGGALAGVLTGVAGMFVLPRQYCSFEEGGLNLRTPAPGSQSCTYGPLNLAVGSAGLGIIALAVVAYFLDRPTTGQFVEAVNEWNDDNPAAPFLPKYVQPSGER
jgi:hypothetical protein